MSPTGSILFSTWKQPLSLRWTGQQCNWAILLMMRENCLEAFHALYEVINTAAWMAKDCDTHIRMGVQPVPILSIRGGIWGEFVTLQVYLCSTDFFPLVITSMILRPLPTPMILWACDHRMDWVGRVLKNHQVQATEKNMRHFTDLCPTYCPLAHPQVLFNALKSTRFLSPSSV